MLKFIRKAFGVKPKCKPRFKNCDLFAERITKLNQYCDCTAAECKQLDAEIKSKENEVKQIKGRFNIHPENIILYVGKEGNIVVSDVGSSAFILKVYPQEGCLLVVPVNNLTGYQYKKLNTITFLPLIKPHHS